MFTSSSKRPYFMSQIGRQALFLLPLLLCLILMPAAAPAAQSGPISALAKAQKAIDTSDSYLMNQAIDLNSVLNKASDTLMASLKQQI